MARIQAEQLAAMLERLPRIVDPAAAEAIRQDSQEAHALLAEIGEDAGIAAAADGLEAILRENAALKEHLESLANHYRTGTGSQERLRTIQRDFVASVSRDAVSLNDGQNFQTLTSRDRAGKSG